ncbi:MAG: hypothetical protein EBS05_06410 [Proteobacteria bacterium]|nr:hypothetical protein [Pseudomonadota bacterium]
MSSRVPGWLKWLFAVTAVVSLNLSSSAADLPETPPEFVWAVRAGGKLHDKTRCLCVDAKGYVFLTGEFAGTSQFGDHTLTSAGELDFFVAKCDPNGKFLWARSAGGSGIDRGYGVATDAAGNCFVTGHFQSTNAMFSGVAVPNSGDYDIFVAKYDPDGKLLWVRTAGGKGYDYGHGIAVDSQGRALVIGALVGEGAFGDVKINAATGAHVFCACYDGMGKLVWAKTAEGKASNSGHGIAVDSAGNAYVGGYTGGSGMIGGLALTNAAGRDVFVAKFTPEGKVAWLSEGHGSTNAMVHEIICDRAGNVWAAGMFKGVLKLGDRTVTSHGDNDLLLTALDPSGKRLWTRTGGGPRVDYGLGVATDGAGNSFLTGEFTETAEIAGTSITSVGSTDIYVAKFDRTGNLRWLTQAGGDKGDNAYTIVADAQGNLYFSGSFSGTAKFGAHTITSAGGNDVYLAKLKAK